MTIPARLLTAALILTLPGAALAARRHAPAIQVTQAWSRPTPPAAPTAVGYLTVENHGRRPDRLVRLSSPAADQVRVHAMSMTGGVMRMRPVEGGLDIPAGGQVTLDAHGDHLMFEGLKHPFKRGGHIPVTLVFEHAGSVRVSLAVQDDEPGARMAGMAMPKP